MEDAAAAQMTTFEAVRSGLAELEAKRQSLLDQIAAQQAVFMVARQEVSKVKYGEVM